MHPNCFPEIAVGKHMGSTAGSFGGPAAERRSTSHSAMPRRVQYLRGDGGARTFDRQHAAFW